MKSPGRSSHLASLGVDSVDNVRFFLLLLLLLFLLFFLLLLLLLLLFFFFFFSSFSPCLHQVPPSPVQQSNGALKGSPLNDCPSLFLYLRLNCWGFCLDAPRFVPIEWSLRRAPPPPLIHQQLRLFINSSSVSSRKRLALDLNQIPTRGSFNHTLDNDT